MSCSYWDDPTPNNTACNRCKLAHVTAKPFQWLLSCRFNMGAMVQVLITHIFHSKHKYVVIKPKNHVENGAYLLAKGIDMGQTTRVLWYRLNMGAGDLLLIIWGCGWEAAMIFSNLGCPLVLALPTMTENTVRSITIASYRQINRTLLCTFLIIFPCTITYAFVLCGSQVSP